MINLSALKANVDLEIEASKKESNEVFHCTMSLAELISEALERETASDKVEVVRCKDCKHWGGVTYGQMCRKYSGAETKVCTGKDHYCSYGERRAEE
jgi:hypothetical protein